MLYRVKGINVGYVLQEKPCWKFGAIVVDREHKDLTLLVVLVRLYNKLSFVTVEFFGDDFFCLLQKRRQVHRFVLVWFTVIQHYIDHELLTPDCFGHGAADWDQICYADLFQFLFKLSHSEHEFDKVIGIFHFEVHLQTSQHTVRLKRLITLALHRHLSSLLYLLHLLRWLLSLLLKQLQLFRSFFLLQRLETLDFFFSQLCIFQFLFKLSFPSLSLFCFLGFPLLADLCGLFNQEFVFVDELSQVSRFSQEQALLESLH